MMVQIYEISSILFFNEFFCIADLMTYCLPNKINMEFKEFPFYVYTGKCF